MTKMFKTRLLEELFFMSRERALGPSPPHRFPGYATPPGQHPKEYPGAALRGDLKSDPSGLGTRLLVRSNIELCIITGSSIEEHTSNTSHTVGKLCYECTICNLSVVL